MQIDDPSFKVLMSSKRAVNKEITKVTSKFKIYAENTHNSSNKGDNSNNYGNVDNAGNDNDDCDTFLDETS